MTQHSHKGPQRLVLQRIQSLSEAFCNGFIQGRPLVHRGHIACHLKAAAGQFHNAQHENLVNLCLKQACHKS